MYNNALNVFGSMGTVAFQSVFHPKMYQNNIFFKKKLFLTSAHQNNLKTPKKYYFKVKQKINKKI
jgi:hypothetical protein